MNSGGVGSLKLHFGLALTAFAALGTASAQPPGADLTVVPAVPKSYKPKLTPWGEPDLRGGWPIDFLNGTPMQRDPAQGDRMFLTDAEFAERTKRVDTAAGRYTKEESGDKLGQGHWVEMGEASRRSSLLISPANGRLPAMTEEGKRRSALMRSSWRKALNRTTPSKRRSMAKAPPRRVPMLKFESFISMSTVLNQLEVLVR